MNAFSDFVNKVEAGFQYDEKWLVSEISKAVHLVENVGHAMDVDIQNIFKWISDHHTSLQNSMKGALEAITLLGSIVPQAAPAVTAATLAIDAATAAIDTLSQHVVAGSTPISTVVNAYHAVKDAQTAVNTVLKTATPKPTK